MLAWDVAIRSFGSRATKRFAKGSRKQFPPHLASKIIHLLGLLSKSHSPTDMAFPGAKLHPLRGSRKGLFAVSISARWRLVFRFRDGDAYDVEVVDYHGE